MAIAFDYANKHILLTAPESTDVTLQALCDEIADVEDSDEGMQYDSIAAMTGKVDRGGGVYTGILLVLSSDWQIKYPAGNYQAVIRGGDILGGVGGQPVAYEAGVQVTIVQDGGGVIAEKIVDTGSGLTVAQAQQLLELWQRFGLDNSALVVDDDTGEISFAGITQDVATVGNRTTVTRR